MEWKQCLDLHQADEKCSGQSQDSLANPLSPWHCSIRGWCRGLGRARVCWCYSHTSMLKKRGVTQTDRLINWRSKNKRNNTTKPPQVNTKGKKKRHVRAVPSGMMEKAGPLAKVVTWPLTLAIRWTEKLAPTNPILGTVHKTLPEVVARFEKRASGPLNRAFDYIL